LRTTRRLAFVLASGVFFQPVQHHVVVIAGFEIIKHMFDFAVGVDEEANTMDTVVGFPHKGFFTPDTKLLAYLMIFIRQQREVQQLFFGETGEFFWFIGADTQYFNACFFRSSILSRKPHACTVQPGVMAFG
jgi:hypothetical protein